MAVLLQEYFNFFNPNQGSYTKEHTKFHDIQGLISVKFMKPYPHGFLPLIFSKLAENSPAVSQRFFEDVFRKDNNENNNYGNYLNIF
jgi:hypothetical protein